MSRRFIQFGIADLERRAKTHPQDIPDIVHELSFRSTRAAKRLKHRLEGSSDVPSGSNVERGAQASLPLTRTVPPRQRPENWKTMFSYPATPEQEEAVDLFIARESMKISAFAGAGKTSTLKFLAATAPHERGLYLAFNRSIADEARTSFNGRVDCKTTHKAAKDYITSHYTFPFNQLVQSMNARQLASEWKLPAFKTSFIRLRPETIAYLISATVKNFCQSADDEIVVDHVVLAGKTLGLPERAKTTLQDYVREQAKKLWEQMTDESSSIPLGFDGYLKLWSLQKPKLPYDYILLDEAQDTKPRGSGSLRSAGLSDNLRR